MYPDHLPLSERLKKAHAQSWQDIASPGDFFNGRERIAMVRAARDALTCALCDDRKTALSPNSVHGEHDNGTELRPVIVDAIHRIRTDPGRLTHSWFKTVTADISQAEYVEIVSVVTSAVIIDTLHNALGFRHPKARYTTRRQAQKAAEPRCYRSRRVGADSRSTNHHV